MSKKSRFTFTLLLLSALALIITGCQSSLPPAVEETDRVEVVTTIFPLADMIQCLGGERVKVSYLLPAGASPHNFEPTVDQIKKTARALLFVYMGGGLDDWAAKAARAESKRICLLSLSEKALQLGWLPPEDISSGLSEKEPVRFNPHLWLDPILARDYLCPALTEALVKIDSKNEAYYRANLKSYQAELTALDEEIRLDLSGLPRKNFISIHAAWHYFAARYGLDEAAVISDFPGQEPSAAWISELVDLCRKHQVRVVSAEPQLSAEIAEMIAHEIEGQLIILDPLGGAELPQRDSYLNLMRYNATVLKDALSE